MPTGNPVPASAMQVARYGHIASQLRDYMQRHKLSNVTLSAQIGGDKNGSLVSRWATSKGGPSPRYRMKLAKLTGIAEPHWRPHDIDEAPLDPVPATSLVIGELMPRRRLSDVLSFNFDSDGKARVKLDIELPLAQAMPLFRQILDSAPLKKLAEQDETE